ncbi:MAG: DMT family transporter [Bacteroidales bacterium]|nr:DMT family transporter [Bacteroidales bacterium]
MFELFKGEFYALFTAILWVFGALIFESLGKKNGADSINILRLVFALVFLSIFTTFSRNHTFPVDASTESWLWLLLSGIVGFALGDLFLFKAFVLIGARVSILIMSLAPPIAAFLGWIILGETLTSLQFLGIVITLFGVTIVVIQKDSGIEKNGDKNKKLKYPVIGVLLALGGAVGQGTGLVLSKMGMGPYDAFASSQIRIIAGILGLAVFITFSKGWQKVVAPFKKIKTISLIALGSVFGSFLGISFSLLAVQNTNTGVASTIMAIQPILLIPASAVAFKEKVNFIEIAGAIIAVGGVVLFFV